MSNHGWVKTRKIMDADRITNIFEELNQTLFKGNLKIEYKNSNDPEAWGEHCWYLVYKSNNQEWAERVCWLNTPTYFEMRHGGGSRFAWWIDTAIINEIAVRHNGKIGDDAGSDRWKGEPGKYSKFSEYLDLVTEHYTKVGYKEQMLEMEMPFIPPEFQDESQTSQKSL